jgi:proteasome beta subunit
MMTQDHKNEYLKGTTTVGIVAKDGVVLGSERRATMGYTIAHKHTQKVFKVDDNLGMTIAGLIGDAQVLVRYIRAEVQLYRLKRGQPMTVQAATTLMSNILHGSRYYPYWVGLIMGGIDSSGGHVYALDAAGGSVPDNYVSIGSGSITAYGVLEDSFEPKMDLKSVIEVAVRALHAAQERDAASGNGYCIAKITNKGYEELSEKELESYLKKVKK